MSPAHNLRKQIGPWPGSSLFDTQMLFLKEFFEKVDFEKKKKKKKKKQQTTKKHEKVHGVQSKNTHADVYRESRCLMFGPSLPLDTFFLHTSIRGPCEHVHINRLIWALATRRCDDNKYKTLCTAH